MIKASLAKCIGVNITPNYQSAFQANGCTPLMIVGEMNFTIMHDNRKFILEAQVIKELDVDIDVGSTWCFIQKFSGSQLRAISYKVRIKEYYCVPEHRFQPVNHTVEYANDGSFLLMKLS